MHRTDNSISTVAAPRRAAILLVAIVFACSLAVGCANDIHGRFVLEPGSHARFSMHGTRNSIRLKNEGPDALQALITRADSQDFATTIKPGEEIRRTAKRHLAVIITTVGDRTTTIAYHIHGTENAFAEYNGVRFTDPHAQMEDFEHAAVEPSDEIQSNH